MKKPLRLIIFIKYKYSTLILHYEQVKIYKIII